MSKQVVLLSKELLPENIAHLNGSLSVTIKFIFTRNFKITFSKSVTLK